MTKSRGPTKEVSGDAALRQEGSWAPDVLTCPNCGSELQAHRVTESWIEVPIDDLWVASYRILTRGDELAVGEMRIFPNETDRAIGRPLAEVLGVPEITGLELDGTKVNGLRDVRFVSGGEQGRSAGRWSEQATSVPEGGLPSDLPRGARVGDVGRVLSLLKTKWLEKWGEEKTREIFAHSGFDPFLPLQAVKPGRRKLSDLALAKMAARYEELAKKHHDVLTRMAREMFLSPETVRRRLRAATNRGILTKGSHRGKADRRLTAKGRRILKKGA